MVLDGTDFKLCDFEVKDRPILNMIDRLITFNNLQTCVNFAQRFEADTAIFCGSLKICGIELNFDEQILSRSFWKPDSNWTLAACQVFVDTRKANCTELKSDLKSLGVLEGERDSHRFSVL